MRRYLLELLAFLMFPSSIFANTLNIDVRDISCAVNGKDAQLFFFKSNTAPVTITSRADICAMGFEYFPSRGNPIAGILLSAPIELGLKAKNNVYRISFENGVSKIIGELPVTAEQIAEDVFQDIFQEGGSIFLNMYTITSDRLELAPRSYEMVFDGVLCIHSDGRVTLKGISNSTSCSNIRRATSETPLCVAHNASNARLTSMRECKKLEAKFRSQ